jgi:hypothetical protein
MNDQRMTARGPELGRWMFVAALLLIGLGLYFAFAPTSEPPARPPAQEGQ